MHWISNYQVNVLVKRLLKQREIRVLPAQQSEIAGVNLSALRRRTTINQEISFSVSSIVSTRYPHHPAKRSLSRRNFRAERSVF